MKKSLSSALPVASPCRAGVLTLWLGLAAWFLPAVSGNTQGILVPYFRFRLYNSLDSETLEHADTLGYDVDLWNYPGSNEIELLSYASIAQLDDGLALTMAIDGLGFNFEQYNCWIAHYGDFDWVELVANDLHKYWADLGWTEEMWESEGEEAPDSNNKFWSEFTNIEREAAIELCYTEELWNGLGLDVWPELPEAVTRAPTDTGVPTLAPFGLEEGDTESPTTVSPTASPTNPMPTEQPSGPTTLPPAPAFPSVDNIRYVLWDDLSEEQRSRAEALRYSRDTWNLPGSASIEEYSFEYVELATGIEGAQDGIEALGFDEDMWNCHINHFSYFGYENIIEEGVEPFVRALGWNAASWAGEADPPPSSNMTWVELTDRERQAAAALCYRQETYDYWPMTNWTMFMGEPESPSSTNTSSGDQQASPETPDIPVVETPDIPMIDIPASSPTTENPVVEEPDSSPITNSSSSDQPPSTETPDVPMEEGSSPTTEDPVVDDPDASVANTTSGDQQTSVDSPDMPMEEGSSPTVEDPVDPTSAPTSASSSLADTVMLATLSGILLTTI